MLIDLLSTSNYVSYNVYVAQVLGIEEAVYLSEVININSKAIRKNKVDDEKYFTLDRSYLKFRTALSEDTQLKIEEKLLKIGLLEKASNDQIYVNVQNLASIIMDPDEKLKTSINEQIKKKSTKSDKKIAINNKLKQFVMTTDPTLRQLFYEWIDNVYDKSGPLNQNALINAQQKLQQYTQNSIPAQVDVMKFAVEKAWRDMDLIIEKYSEKYNKTYKFQQQQFNMSPISVSREVF